MTRVVYFGNERLVSGLEKTSAPILNGLLERNYEVVAIVSHHSPTQSRNERKLEVAEIAEKHDIPLYTPSRPSEIIDTLRGLNAEIAVLAAYGRIISQDIIDLFPKGIINIHPSLLPKYRGPTPIESAILNGDDATGISIMHLTAGMDEGPVYSQCDVPLSGNETKNDLYEKIANASTELFFDSFPRIVDGTLEAFDQDDSKATYSKLIRKSDGFLQWDEPAAQLERKIRAYAGWPQSRATIGGLDVIISSAHVEEVALPVGSFQIVETKSLIIGTSKGGLSIDRIKPAGKKEMPISAFLLGYGPQLKAVASN